MIVRKSSDYWGQNFEAIKRSNKDRIYRELVGANNFNSHGWNLVSWNLSDDLGHKLEVIGTVYQTIK